MNIRLEGKRALVCGSTQGIGKAIAVALAELGASITLIARNEEKLKETIKKLTASHTQRHEYICVNFDEPQKVKDALDQYLEKEKKIHILINNTGGPPGGLAMNASIDEFQKAFSNHLVCNHILTQAVIPSMKAEAYGRIINIISTSVKAPLPGLGVSNTIRGAVANWAKTLAMELGPFGITVNNVLPGATETARLQSIIETKAQKENKPLAVIKDEMVQKIPLRRFALPEEVAAAATFLASPAAAYINGINIPVDGGRTNSL